MKIEKTWKGSEAVSWARSALINFVSRVFWLKIRSFLRRKGKSKEKVFEQAFFGNLSFKKLQIQNFILRRSYKKLLQIKICQLFLFKSFSRFSFIIRKPWKMSKSFSEMMKRISWPLKVFETFRKKVNKETKA